MGCHAGGWGVSCRGGMGHAGVWWGGSCRGGVGWGVVGHLGVGGLVYSCRGIYIQHFMSDSNSKNNNL